MDVAAANGGHGMLHVELLRDRGIVILTPEGKLEASDFERVGREVDPFIDANGMLSGLMVCAKTFPGWADFAALITHIRFVRDHHRKIRRIAAVSDSEFAKIMPAIAKHFVAADLRHFPFDAKEQALAWLEADR
jgi:hypothetical protein